MWAKINEELFWKQIDFIILFDVLTVGFFLYDLSINQSHHCYLLKPITEYEDLELPYLFKVTCPNQISGADARRKIFEFGR